jgi:hypothetical protein
MDPNIKARECGLIKLSPITGRGFIATPETESEESTVLKVLSVFVFFFVQAKVTVVQIGRCLIEET